MGLGGRNRVHIERQSDEERMRGEGAGKRATKEAPKSLVSTEA